MAFPYPAYMGKAPAGSGWAPGGAGPAGMMPPTWPGKPMAAPPTGWMTPPGWAGGKASPGWAYGKTPPGMMAPPPPYQQGGTPLYMSLPGYAMGYPSGEMGPMTQPFMVDLMAVIEPALSSVLPAIEGLLRISALLLGQQEEADLLATWSGLVNDAGMFDGIMQAAPQDYQAGTYDYQTGPPDDQVGSAEYWTSPHQYFAEGPEPDDNGTGTGSDGPGSDTP